MNLLSLSLLSIAMTATPTDRHRPEIVPSFDEVYCAWRATHIVIADEGQLIDGKLTILRSLKGDLSPGAQLSLPELAQFAEPKSRTTLHFGVPGGPPNQPIQGKKLLLYLIQSADGWKGAGWVDQLLISFAWLESEGPFARKQLLNPGALGVLPLHKSTEALIAQTCYIVQDREAVRTALALSSPELRCKALHEVLLTCCKWNRERVASLVIKTGHPSAMALMRQTLAEDGRIDLHRSILWAICQTKTEGNQGLSLLLGVAHQDLEYWSSTEIDPTRFDQRADQNIPEVKHYLRTHTVLSLLNEHDNLRQDKSVAKLIEFWDEHTALDQWLRPAKGFPMRNVSDLIRSKYPKR